MNVGKDGINEIKIIGKIDCFKDCKVSEVLADRGIKKGSTI